VLSAALLGLYSRGGVGYVLGFVALVPWLLALDSLPSVARVIRSGLLMSVLFVAAVFAWFGVAIGAYTGIGSATGLLIVLAAAPLLQAQLVAFALVRYLAGRRFGVVIRTLAGASAWVATEWLLPKLLGDTIGHGLYPSQYLRQFADVGGAAALTFLLILVNECIAYAITQRTSSARLLVKPMAVAALIPIVMASYGAVRLSELALTSASGGQTLRIGMLQSNITDYERLRREMGAYDVVRHVLDTHYAMSREAIDQHDVDALLWSETVYPTTFSNPKSDGGAELDKEILDFVTASKVPLVFGTYDLDESGEYNAAAFVEPSSRTLGFYRKTDLFLFTEYLPTWLDGAAVRGLLPWTGTWKQGSGARVFPLRLADGREIPVLPMICLDDVNSNLAIDGSRLGAQVILGMSNDSWFTQHPIGAKLHLHVAAFRSIETRLPQMRVTSNGVSAVIDSNGSIIASTAMAEQKLLIGEVTVNEPPITLMVRWGDWFGRACFVFLALLALFPIIKIVKPRSAHSATLSSAAVQENFQVEGIVLSRFWRVAASLLRVFAAIGLLWMAKLLLLGGGAEGNTLSHIGMFAAVVLAPATAAWAIMRAFSASICIENTILVLQQRERRIEISVNDIAAVDVWKLPLPVAGVNIRLTSTQNWSQGVAVADPSALIQALIRAGASSLQANSSNTFMTMYVSVRANVSRWPIDHFSAKFVAFPFLLAIPAFRLHQHIAYGGTFGEYQTFGLKAYFIAFLIWWASWAIGMVLLAALLRIIIEIATLLSILLHRQHANDVRSWLELLGRLCFYVGVPIWMLIRFWP
jgi:apolipoprotein N-acyltransferase